MRIGKKLKKENEKVGKKVSEKVKKDLWKNDEREIIVMIIKL